MKNCPTESLQNKTQRFRNANQTCQTCPIETYPIKTISIDEAIDMQYRLVDCITREFDGVEVLQTGDLGLDPENNQPRFTRKVEKVLADFFKVEDAVLVRGSGTGAIREGLSSIMKSGENLLVHSAEIYSTTKTTVELMGYNLVIANFNDYEELKNVIRSNSIQACLIQYTRQAIDDFYDIKKVIEIIKSVDSSIKIITDDNYAVMKVECTGAELGADISAFSLFKLLGPEGIGLVIGNRNEIEKIRKFHYSGGSQVQGFEAMEALRSLVFAPVQLALQSKQIDDLYKILKENYIKEIEDVVIANAQSKVLLVKFKDKIAKRVLKEAVKLGAAAYPVGSESRYEISPMFYRLSGTMRRANSEYEDYWIRINPMKSGKDTVIRILEESIKKVNDVFKNNI